MNKILIGSETEYGLLIEGRGAEDQVEDATAFVRAIRDFKFIGWDYRYESPRSDLRGFRLDHLAFDPEDAKFDAGKSYGSASDIRSDRILANGARFYNDHGHPEYSTPECRSIFELALHDRVGQSVLQTCSELFSQKIGKNVSVYKNNTDFHGASYGTHENYLVRRSVEFDRLFRGVLPMLVARQVLTGAGKVGSETSEKANFQLSQRADFFMEPVNAETLFRRPIFNTRDEPHADASKWVRLHVICGDANMIGAATARKFGLVKIAIALTEIGAAPLWKLADPVKAFRSISRDESLEFRLELEGRSWTTAPLIIESYFAAAERFLDLDDETKWVIASSRQLLEDLHCKPDRFRREVDWAAKRFALEQVMEAEGIGWRDPSLLAYDLQYHNVDAEEGLLGALIEMGEVDPDFNDDQIDDRKTVVTETTRARARSLAVSKFGQEIETLSWGSIVFRDGDSHRELFLPPDVEYPKELESAEDVGTFISAISDLSS